MEKIKNDKNKQEFHLIDVEDSKNVFFISTTNKAFLNRLGIRFDVISPINENGYTSVEFSLGESSIKIDVINNDLNPIINELKNPSRIMITKKQSHIFSVEMTFLTSF